MFAFFAIKYVRSAVRIDYFELSKRIHGASPKSKSMSAFAKAAPLRSLTLHADPICP